MTATHNRPAAAVPLPARLLPHLAVLGQMPADPDEFVLELKYDGYRLLARIDKEIRLFTKNAHDWTARLQPLRDALLALDLPAGFYDGEMVMCDAAGKPDFSLLQSAMARRDASGLVYYLFDAPFFDDRDLRQLPLVERRELLENALRGRDSTTVRFSAELHGAADQVLAAACAMNLEGVMCKRRDSVYADGRRSSSWRKLKCGQRGEYVIAGFTGGASGIDRLLLGAVGADGALRYAGSVGAGFTQQDRRDLAKALGMIATDRCPLTEPEIGRAATWVEPVLVAMVAFAEAGNGGRLRHAVYRGVRARA